MFNHRPAHQFLLLAMLLSLLFSPLKAQAIQEKPHTDHGMRIVSLSPNVTETLFALGAGSSVVGRSDYCNYPNQVLALPSVGTLYNPSLETLLSLNPTLVISSAFVDDQFLASIQKAGIAVLQLNTQQTFQGTYDLIRDIGEAVGRQEQAELMILSMQNTVHQVVMSVQNLPKPSVYAVIDFGGFDSTATGDTFFGDMIELAGGSNVAKDAKNWTYSKELLMEKDPDLLLISPRWGESGTQTIAEFTAMKPYSDLQGEIRLIDADLISRQGPRSAQALASLASVIHPELGK
ncbi:MAG: ABC transporter substrate-binding protein [Sphaerochaeta sp.]|jgi:iron complex transport system substrate-binding protein|uniref:ABC transporter substrate-binding protein n=1 Tax=Sphaerochaeta sp. TaxID=1972642 RepID=UPI003D127624